MIYQKIKKQNFEAYECCIEKSVHQETSYISKKYDNTAHKIIKKKPVQVKTDIQTDTHVTFKIDKPKSNHARISKYSNEYSRGYKPNWYEEIFMIKKVKDISP